MREIDKQLLYAILKGRCAEIDNLLERGADVNCICDEELHNTKTRMLANTPEMAVELGETPIMVAAAYGQLAVMKLLVSHGADIHYQTEQQRTALLTAAYNDFKEGVKYLLEQGADINQVNDEKYNALMLATDAYLNNKIFNSKVISFELIEFLIKKGIDLDWVNQYQVTALEKVRLQDYVLHEHMKKIIQSKNDHVHLCKMINNNTDVETIEF